MVVGAVPAVLLSAGVAAASLALSGQVVGSPGTGAVFTAEGAGGSTATTVEPGVDPSSEPTVPTLYLRPVALTAGGTQPAYWKVWWSGTARTKYVVALQQHIDAAHAQTEAQQLDLSNRSPSSVQGSSEWSYASSFGVPSVPGAVGLVWTATIGGVADEFRFAVFTRGDLVELVSVTTYGAPTSQADLDAFALAQYDHSGGGGTGQVAPVLWVVLAVVVAAAIAWSLARSRRKAHRRPAAVGYGPMVGAAGYGYGPPPAGYGPASRRLRPASRRLRPASRRLRPASEPLRSATRSARAGTHADRAGTALVRGLPGSGLRWTSHPFRIRPGDRARPGVRSGPLPGRAGECRPPPRTHHPTAGRPAGRLVPGPGAGPVPAGTPAVLGRHRLDRPLPPVVSRSPACRWRLLD